MKHYPPQDNEEMKHEIFFLLKRLQDVIDIVDNKEPLFQGGKEAALDYARKSLEYRNETLNDSKV